MPQATNSAEAVPSIRQGSGDQLASFKKMSLEELMDQQVTSVSKQPEPYREAPAAIEVITQEDIRRSGATSIPEALRLADNLDVAQTSSSTWAISARGFNSSVSDKLLVLVDGRSVYTPLFSGVIWNMQDYMLEDIDRIEVISGPGGTLWGANAVNGVINITTKNAKDTQGLYAEGGGGSLPEGFAGVRYGGVLASNVYFRVYGKYFYEGAEEYRDGSRAGDAWTRGQAGFRIDAEGSPQNQFVLEGDGFGGNNDVIPGGEGTPSATGYTSGGHVLGRWTHTFAEDSDMSFQLYYDRTDLQAPFQSAVIGAFIPSGTLVDDLDTYDLDFQHHFALGERQNVVWGFGYRFTHDVTTAAPLVAFLPPTLDRNLFNVFVQDEIKVFERVFLTVGSKLEHNDYTGFEYEPGGRLQWNFTEKQMVWGAVSRAVRTPSRYDRDLFEPSPAYGTFLGGNSDFHSETVIAYEVGYRAQLNNDLSTSLSAFYNDYQDLRSLGFLHSYGTLPLAFQNNLRAETYGIELSLNYQVMAGWRLHGGYDLLKEHVRINGSGDLYNGLNETADPENQIFVRSSMDLPWRTELDTALRWIDRVNNNNGGSAGVVPSYAELDLRLAWHPVKTMELSIVGQNLLHEHHVEAGFPGTAQEQIQRTIYGKIALSF